MKDRVGEWMVISDVIYMSTSFPLRPHARPPPRPHARTSTPRKAEGLPTHTAAPLPTISAAPRHKRQRQTERRTQPAPANVGLKFRNGQRERAGPRHTHTPKARHKTDNRGCIHATERVCVRARACVCVGGFLGTRSADTQTDKPQAASKQQAARTSQKRVADDDRRPTTDAAPTIRSRSHAKTPDQLRACMHACVHCVGWGPSSARSQAEHRGLGAGDRRHHQHATQTTPPQTPSPSLSSTPPRHAPRQHATPHHKEKAPTDTSIPIQSIDPSIHPSPYSLPVWPPRSAAACVAKAAHAAAAHAAADCNVLQLCACV